jgi:diguanylate cyclase (GGDEF)-like protein
MKSIAIRDQLTTLLNRRGFNESGKRAFSSARRNKTPLSIIMADIDRFKYINDKFGHAAGDRALIHFAQLISENRRQEDVVARVGGEEFALLLPGTELRDAMAIADQLCSKIGSTPLDITAIGMPMTSSFGVAAISASDTSLDAVVLRADRALYRSKRAGRNQVDLESSQLMMAEDGTLIPV